MSRIIVSLLLLVVFARFAVGQPVAEPQRIQRATYDAKPIDKRAAEAASTAVAVPIDQLGKQFRLIGKLGVPLGEVVRVQGLIVQTGKESDTRLQVRVYRVQGEATQQFLQLQLTDYYGRDEIPLQPGKPCELVGFETGGFVGNPAEAVKRGGAVVQPSQRTGDHHFRHEFKVIEANEITLQPFTPADFLGREMLVQGQAISDNGSAFIMGNKWKLLVDNGTPWSRTSEGKTVEARGVIRTIGKTTTYRLENSGKANNARLVQLADQVGKPVTLRGIVDERNGQQTFRYRGQSVHVDGLKELVAAAGSPCEAQVSGTLEVIRTTVENRAGFPGERETRTQFLVRKATLKPAENLLAIERAEAVE